MGEAMAQEGPKAVISVVAEDNTKEGLDQVKRGVQDTAQAVTKAGQEASKGISQMGAGAEQTARKLESFEKSWVNSVQRAQVAMEAGEKGTAKYYEVLGKFRGVGGDVLEPVIAQLKAAEAAQEAASASMGRMGMSAKATAAAMRGVPAQLSDIFVSIQGGMPLFTVFTQQGLQLRDMFGGFGAAGKALATTVAEMVNPLTVAGAAAVAVGAAYYQGSKEVEALRVSLVATGNSMGASVTQLRQFAAEMGAIGGNEAKASSALADFVDAGVRGTTMLKENAQAAIDWEKATGTSVEKTAKAFASLQDEPLKAAMDLQKGMNFLTVATYEQAKALEEQGRKTEATALLQREYAKALNQGSSEIRDNLGTLERTWDKLGKTASTVWNLMLGVGRSATLADKIGGLREEISNTERQLAAGTGFSETAGGAATGRGGRLTQKDIELLQQRLALNKQNLTVLEEEARQDQVKAERKAEEGRRVSALDEWNQRELKYLSDAKKLERELEQERQLGRRAGLGEEEINKRLNAMREEAAKKDKDAAKAAKEHKKELSEQAKVYADLAGLSSTYYDDLARGQKELAKGIMTQAQYVKYVEDLIKKQPFAIALAKEEERVTLARVKAWNDEVKVQEKLLEERQRAAAQVEETLKKAKDEEEAHILAAAAGITHAEALARIALARAEDSYQKELAKGADAETLLALQKEIEARKQLQVVMQQKGVREANKKAADDAAKDWDRTAQTISRTLSDYIMAGGKNAAQYLKRLFATLVLEPMVQTAVGSVFGVGKSALAAGESGSSALSTASNANSLLSMTGAVGAGVKAGLQGWAGTLGLSGTGTTLGGSLSAGFTALGSGNIAGGLGTLLGVAGPVLGGLALLSSLDFGSRGANHTGGAYSTSSSDRNAAASQALGSDAWGNALGDITSRANTALDKQLGKTVDALSGVYTSLAKYAGDSAKQIDIAAAFAVNPSHSDEDNYGYFRLIDKITGEALSTYKARDGVLGTDPEKAYATFVGEMGGALVEQLKAADIPGWMRSIFDDIGEVVTVDGIEKALVAIAAADAAFKGWGDTLTGFADLSAEVQTSLIKTSGTIEGLGANISAFYSGFYTEQERMGILQRQVLDQLASLDVTVDTSTAEAAKASFKAAVEGALAAGNGELAAQLLALSGNFATAADYAAKAVEEAVQAASQALEGLMTDRRQLEAELLQAQGNATGYAAAMRAIAVEGFGPAELAAYDYNDALRAQITEAERAATATQDAASALASLRQQAAGIVQSQQQGLDSLIAGLQRKAEQAAGGYVGNLWLSGAEFTQFSGFADQLTGATDALEQLQALGLGDELAGYADQIGTIVQNTKEALAGALSSQRLLSGDAAGALAAAISASMPQYADYTSDGGQFDAGAYNAASTTQRAKVASGLIGDASASALSIPGIAGVLGSLVGEIATYSREVVLRDLRAQGSESLGPMASGLLTGVYERLADAAQAQMISGPGLGSIMSARMQYGAVSASGYVPGYGQVVGEDLQELAKALSSVRGELAAGKITATEADKALEYLGATFGDLVPLLSDVAGQTARAAAAAEGLRSAGLAGVEYYFGSLAGVVSQLDAAAAAANSPLAQTTSVIGLLDSTATAFGQSAGAALEGAQAAIAGYLDAAAMAREQGALAESWSYNSRAADAQLALNGMLGADSRVSRAQMIADAAAMASGIMTTASAAKAAEELAGKLVLGEGQSMRDLSLLVSGVGQYDNAGFYDAFARISDALGSGSISNEQYKTLFDYALGTYQGVDDQAKATASAFERLRDSMKSFADSLLIGDKTTLSPEATLAEMQRQYAEAFKLAAGGDTDAVSTFQSLANGLLDKSLYSSQAEYNVAFGRAYGDARALESQGVNMLAAQQNGVATEVKALNKRIEGLEKNLMLALAQIAKHGADTVKGINKQTLVIEEGSS